MKRVILLFNFVLSTCISYGQDFLQLGNQWLFERNEVSINPSETQPISQTIESMTIIGEVIINSKTYFEVEITEDQECLYFRDREYLREEDSRIYRLSRDQTVELLMIDFGETDSYILEYEHIWEGNGYDTQVMTVDSFSNEIIDNQLIKTQYLHFLDPWTPGDTLYYKVHEKIGFGYLLFHQLSTGLCDAWDYYNKPRCFISNQDTLHFSEYNCHESSIISNTQELGKQSINIFPNPTHRFLYLPDEFELVHILNSNGKKYRACLENNTLDMNSLPDGIYFLRIRSKANDKISTRKIIKHSF